MELKSVTKGNIASLESLKDGVFSAKMMGDGVVVTFEKNATKGEIYAPVSGKLVTVFPTGHAYGIKTKEGIEVLIHIGLDTVELKGQGFKSFVKQGKKVKVGAKLAEIDLELVRAKAPAADPIVIITSGQEVKDKANGTVDLDSTIFSV